MQVVTIRNLIPNHSCIDLIFKLAWSQNLGPRSIMKAHDVVANGPSKLVGVTIFSLNFTEFAVSFFSGYVPRSFFLRMLSKSSIFLQG